jgi:hypothetical protein
VPLRSADRSISKLLAHRAFESAAVVVARIEKAPLLAPSPCGGARFPTLAANADILTRVTVGHNGRHEFETPALIGLPDLSERS